MREHEISLSPVSRLGVSLKSASLLPGRVQCSSFQGPKPYKARCGRICSSTLLSPLEKNEHALSLVVRLIVGLRPAVSLLNSARLY